MALPEITEDIIRDLATTSSYLRGIEYFEDGEVDRVWIENGKYHAYVQGAELYKVTISGKKGNIQTTCSCPYDWEGVCKHVVAVMLTVLNEKKAEEHKTKLQEITKLLEDSEPEKIKEIPDSSDRSSRYINHIRTKYKRRYALMDEIKGL